MRRVHYPDNSVAVRDVIRGPHPITTSMIDALDAVRGLDLAGRTGGVRVGEPSSSFVKWSGEGGIQQAFAGGAFMGASRNFRPGFATALPNTHTPPAVANPVMALLARLPS